MNILMALVDFVPVLFFLASAVLLQRDLYNKMSKGAFALFSAGTITTVIAGAFKAIWKLLYCLGICDFVALNKCFFPLQTVGFVLTAAGLLALLFHSQGKNTVYSVAAVPLYESSIIFVVFMVLGVAITNFSMVYIARKMKKYGVIALYIVSFVLILGMGYLSTKDFEQVSMNWLAEGINILGQGTFFCACYQLHKAGLADYRL